MRSPPFWVFWMKVFNILNWKHLTIKAYFCDMIYPFAWPLPIKGLEHIQETHQFGIFQNTDIYSIAVFLRYIPLHSPQTCLFLVNSWWTQWTHNVTGGVGCQGQESIGAAFFIRRSVAKHRGPICHNKYWMGLIWLILGFWWLLMVHQCWSNISPSWTCVTHLYDTIQYCWGRSPWWFTMLNPVHQYDGTTGWGGDFSFLKYGLETWGVFDWGISVGVPTSMQSSQVDQHGCYCKMTQRYSKIILRLKLCRRSASEASSQLTCSHANRC